MGHYTFLFLVSVPFVVVFGNAMLVPILPKIQHGLGVSFLQAILLVSALSLSAALTVVVAGIISDRWGRKTVIVPALTLYGFGGLLIAFLATLNEVSFVSVLVQGIGAGGTSPAGNGLGRDLYQGKERTLVVGLFETSNGLGKVLGSIVGWWVPFWLYGTLRSPRTPRSGSWCPKPRGGLGVTGRLAPNLLLAGIVYYSEFISLNTDIDRTAGHHLRSAAGPVNGFLAHREVYRRLKPAYVEG